MIPMDNSRRTPNAVVILILLVVIGTLLHFLQPILMPFLAGLTLAYLWDPTVDRLETMGMGRTSGVAVVFAVSALLLAALLLVLIPLLGKQMYVLAAKVPAVIQWVKQTMVPWLNERFGVGLNDMPLDELKSALMENWQSAGGFMKGLVTQLTASSFALLGILANLVLVPVVGFYLLRDWDRLVFALRETLPRTWEPTAVQLARECDEVVSAFLRGQLMVMLALTVCYCTGLLLIGLDLALLVGVIAGLSSIVPYLGLVIGIGFASVAALFQFGDWVPLLYVMGIFGVSQLIEGMYLTPKLVGDRIGLHPVVVIFAVMAGGQLFGFTGVLLALPVAAVIMVLLRHLHGRYRASTLYGAAQPSEPTIVSEAPSVEPAAEED